MSKPIYLREETWLFLLQSLAKLQGRTFSVLREIGYVIPNDDNLKENDVLALLAEQPGPFLLHAGILNYPSLFQGTIIELADGREFLINRKTAQALRKKDNIVVATNVSNQKPQALDRGEIINSLKDGLLFDQMSRKMVQNFLAF